MTSADDRMELVGLLLSAVAGTVVGGGLLMVCSFFTL
jgi:hypothetical protein